MMWEMMLGIAVIAGVIAIFVLAAWDRPKKRSDAEIDPMPGHNIRADVHDHNLGP